MRALKLVIKSFSTTSFEIRHTVYRSHQLSGSGAAAFLLRMCFGKLTVFIERELTQFDAEKSLSFIIVLNKSQTGGSCRFLTFHPHFFCCKLRFKWLKTMLPIMKFAESFCFTILLLHIWIIFELSTLKWLRSVLRLSTKTFAIAQPLYINMQYAHYIPPEQKIKAILPLFHGQLSHKSHTTSHKYRYNAFVMTQ